MQIAGRPCPLVSVVVPAHDAQTTIGRCIRSALAQDYPAQEVLVVDDGSTDGTAAAVAALESPGVRLIRLPRQQGAAGARNVGIREACGEYVAFLDADDEWLSAKTTKQVRLLIDNPRMTFASTAAVLVDADGRPLGRLNAGHRPAAGPEAWRALLAYTFVATPAIMARRQALVDAGGFDVSLRVAEDQDLWIRLALAGEVGYLREPLVIVHERADSLTKRFEAQESAYILPVIRKHVAANRSRLSYGDLRRIYGCRFARLGRNAYSRGDWATGVPLLLKAILLGYRPLGSMAYLLTASPAVSFLRNAVPRGLGLKRLAP